MPVTKTAKRAQRSSKRKMDFNQTVRTQLAKAIRSAKKEKTKAAVSTAISFADRAAKKNVIHKNKAARIKSLLSQLSAKKKTSFKKPSKS